MRKVSGIGFISGQLIRWAALSGRLTVSAACLHAVVLAFVCSRVSTLRREPGHLISADVSARRRGKESLLIRRDALRPPHCLGGVAGVAPYSSRRHPSVLIEAY